MALVGEYSTFTTFDELTLEDIRALSVALANDMSYCWPDESYGDYSDLPPDMQARYQMLSPVARAAPPLDTAPRTQVAMEL